MIGRRGCCGRLLGLGVGTALGPGIVEADPNLVPTVAPAVAKYRGGLTIAQIVAVSYPAVLAEMRKTHNQWAESAFMGELQKQGFVVPVHYKRKTSIWTGLPTDES
jgi:hypothetical protein